MHDAAIFFCHHLSLVCTCTAVAAAKLPFLYLYLSFSAFLIFPLKLSQFCCCCCLFCCSLFFSFSFPFSVIWCLDTHWWTHCWTELIRLTYYLLRIIRSTCSLQSHTVNTSMVCVCVFSLQLLCNDHMIWCSFHLFLSFSFSLLFLSNCRHSISDVTFVFAERCH